MGRGARREGSTSAWRAKPPLLQVGKGHGVGDAALAGVTPLRREPSNRLVEAGSTAEVRSDSPPLSVCNTARQQDRRPALRLMLLSDANSEEDGSVLPHQQMCNE